MKKILITGKNSYVGNSLEKWLQKDPSQYSIDKISMRDASWKELDFSKYDVVVHVAGIAHRKETKDNKDLYYRVNRDLSYELAKKAKDAKVKQFIFLSSMSVYGLESGVIDRNTTLNPSSHYGKSKLEAEELIKNLRDDDFKTVILRPPMIYGKDCPGNYQRLAKIAKKTLVFPKIKNKRSMIYIYNLSEFIKILIDDYSSGLYFPQNEKYVNTGEMVKLIAKQYNREVKLISFFNPCLKIIKLKAFRKVFGDLVYAKDTKENDYCIYDFKSSITLTEGK